MCVCVCVGGLEGAGGWTDGRGVIDWGGRGGGGGGRVGGHWCAGEEIDWAGERGDRLCVRGGAAEGEAVQVGSPDG